MRSACRAWPCMDTAPDARRNLPPERADAELQPCETIAASFPPLRRVSSTQPPWLNWQPCPSLFGAAARGEPSALALGLSSVWSQTGGKRLVQRVKRQEGPEVRSPGGMRPRVRPATNHILTCLLPLPGRTPPPPPLLQPPPAYRPSPPAHLGHRIGRPVLHSRTPHTTYPRTAQNAPA